MIQVKESDNRATPKWLMEIFENWFDPCPLNPSPYVDGLEIDWEDKTYVNPPYSCPAKWIYKAIEESKKGKRIVLLIRFDPTTKHFRALIDYGCHIFFCGERLGFTNPENSIDYKSPFPSILVILNSNNRAKGCGKKVFYEIQDGKETYLVCGNDRGLNLLNNDVFLCSECQAIVKEVEDG